MSNELTKAADGDATANEIHRARASLASLTPDSSVEDFATALAVAQRVVEIGREVTAGWKAAALERVEARGALIVGTKKYYAAVEKTTKPVSLKLALDAIMDAAGGDEDELINCLSANAIKPGATRKLLSPERFDAVFVTTEKTVLADGAAPKRVLLEIDERFVR